MDAKEKRLVEVYENAVDELRKTRKGSEESERATARVVVALRKLTEYRRTKK